MSNCVNIRALLSHNSSLRTELFNNDLTQFVPSYDGRNREPITLPAKFPIVLLEGSPLRASFRRGRRFASGFNGHVLAHASNVAALLGCGVANFGQGGYGSDQALLLARAQSAFDRAPVALIGHVSENILRNVNRYRNLVYPGDELGFKPRFAADGDALRVLPVPVAAAADFDRLDADPEAVLAPDAFLARPRRSFSASAPASSARPTWPGARSSCASCGSDTALPASAPR